MKLKVEKVRDDNMYRISLKKEELRRMLDIYGNEYAMEKDLKLSVRYENSSFILYSNVLNMFIINYDYNSGNEEIAGYSKVADCMLEEFMSIIDNINKKTEVRRIGA